MENLTEKESLIDKLEDLIAFNGVDHEDPITEVEKIIDAHIKQKMKEQRVRIAKSLGYKEGTIGYLNIVDFE